MKLVQCSYEHILAIQPRVRGEAKDLDPNQFIGMAQQFSQIGASYAAVGDSGKVYGIGGVFPTHHGTGHVWMCLTDDLKGYGLWCAKAFKAQLKVIMDYYGLWRVQGDVLASRPEWLRWAKIMGFEEEGVMRKYGVNGQDFIRVAKVNYE